MRSHPTTRSQSWNSSKGKVQIDQESNHSEPSKSLINALPVHVFLIAQDRGTVQFATSFENSIEEPQELRIVAPFGRSVALTSEAASEGALGLSISLGTGSVFAQIEPGGPGGNNHGSGGQTGVEPPWPPLGRSTLMVAVGWRLMSFGNGAELELRMRAATDSYEVLMRHKEDPSPDDPGQSWLLVGKGLRRYEVRFWDNGKTGKGLEGSYQLRVDGVVVAERLAFSVQAWPTTERMNAGLEDMPVGASRALEIDGIEVWERAPW